MYLWFIGVSPGVQGQGIGRRFLQELTLNEKNQNRSLILECSPENLNWYKKSGFEIQSA
jgi:ribosomal protein S18 acetylase RimI-like enzyme